MKVVKLNRRFRQFRDHGHVVALRFGGWNSKALAVERVCRARLGGGGWSRDQNWYSYTGDLNRRSYPATGRPYWITFRNEADLTLVLLSADLTK